MSVVTVRWAGGAIRVPKGTLLSDALRMGGLHLDTPCGGNGRCGKCAVRVSPEDSVHLPGARLADGYRLACKFAVDTDVTVSIPALPVGMTAGLQGNWIESVRATEGRREAPGMASGGAGGPVCGLATGQATDQTAGSAVDPAPRPGAGPVASLTDARTTDRVAGLAIDLGTTSISVSLIDLRTGEELASSVRPNPQAAYGADIMSRLLYATARPRNNGKLRRLALDSIAEAFSDLLKSSGVRRKEVLASVLVGNTAMHHLALGLSVKDLSVHPYTAATLKPREADILGIPHVYAPPVVESFVGSDLVAAALATGIASLPTTSLLIDVGTNSEVLLCRNGKLYACSAPAGPAFEGGEISQGMLALPGAVYEVLPEFELSVVGGGQPTGICGSGILDAIVALLRAGILDRSGLMHRRETFSDRIIHETDGSLKFALAPDLFLTQKDIRAVQLAKGALRCAVDALLHEAGVASATPVELDAVYLAGAFGTSLRVASVLEAGLVPPIAPEKVRQVGNAAIVGAKAILLSDSVKAEAERLAKAIQHVDLASIEGFQERFLSSLSFE